MNQHVWTTLKIIDSHRMFLIWEAFLSLVECNHHPVQIVVKPSGICKEILGMNINLPTYASNCVIQKLLKEIIFKQTIKLSTSILDGMERQATVVNV